MSLAWTIILALAASPDAGRSEPHSGRAPARPALCCSSGRAVARMTPCVLSISRKSWHRSSACCWSFSDLDEFDTEEVDETWLGQLDAIASVPGSWLCLAWSRSRSESKAVADDLLAPLGHFPLRC